MVSPLPIIPPPQSEQNGGDYERDEDKQKSWNIVFPIVICLCLLVIVEHFTRVQRFLAWGLSTPPEIYSTGYVIIRFIATLAESITFGVLFFSVINTRSESQLSPLGFFLQKITGKSLLVTIVSSVIAIFLSIASYSDFSSEQYMSWGAYEHIFALHGELYAWLLCIFLSVIAYIILVFATSWQAQVWLISPLSFMVLAVAMTGNAAQGRNHDLATEAQIISTLALGIAVGYLYAHYKSCTIVSEDLRLQLSIRARWVSRIALSGTLVGEIILAVIYLLPLRSFSWFFALTICLLVSNICAICLPRRITPVLLMLGLAQLQDIYPAPNQLHSNLWDRLIGFQLYQGPNFLSIVTHYRIDIFFLLICLSATILYLWGVHIIKARGDQWNFRRTFSWLCGVLMLFIFTCSGFNAYGVAQFSVHMMVHMALNMFVPVLLVLGAPITVIMKVFSATNKAALPGLRECVLGIVHSRLAEMITNPIASVLIFVASLYGLYFTPIFPILVSYAWGHELMNLHFVISGYLLYWPVVGIDPGPKRMQFLARLGVVFILMPFHAFFGIATMNMRGYIIGGSFYRVLQVPWIHNLASDQALAGGIAWAASEIPIVLVILSLLWQWYSQDQRDAKRLDRSSDAHYDQDYEMYNDMLKKLARGEG